jgi:hypothetical protein
MTPDETIEHELAILRPRPGDVLVLYLTPRDGRISTPLIDAFAAATRDKGYVTLVIGTGEGRHVEHWPREVARAVYDTLRRRFAREER